ncbi:MAG: S8 family serine peptidase [Acidimicrobiia bacterium]|nr:S8 family serine peptidase [Acidimicrobiia bacterium]
MAWLVSVLLLVAAAGCGGDAGSVFQTTSSDAAASTTGSSLSSTSTTGVSGDGGEGEEPAFVVPDESTVIQTAGWGEVFDRRIVVRLTDAAGAGAADEVAAAVGGTVVARVDEYLLVEIELPSGGEGAIAAALEVAAARPEVLIAGPSQVVRPDLEVMERPCGPLDALVLEGEGRSDHYRLIGVEDAWRLVRASGVAVTPPKVGFADGFGQSQQYHGLWVNEMVDASPGRDAPGVLDAILPDDQFGWTRVEVFGSSSITSKANTFAGVRYLIGRGAKVINLSLGVNQATPETVALYRAFLRDIAAKHPDVLIVASAGNKAADVATHVPGGLNEPNLVTVGGLNHQGERWQETWTDSDGVEHTAGSNYVTGGDGEVTLAAIAQDVFTGMNNSGEPVAQSGTSFAAPQVTAAVAVLQALDPTLTAAQIKQILVDTAATEIADPAISDRITAVDPALGGRVLRIDNAVWKVLSERLGVTGSREQVIGRALLQARVRPSLDDPLDYRIVATAPQGGDTTIIHITVNGPGALNPGSENLTTDDDVARWRWTFFNTGNTAQISLTRTDTEACARVVITADAETPDSPGSTKEHSTGRSRRPGSRPPSPSRQRSPLRGPSPRSTSGRAPTTTAVECKLSSRWRAPVKAPSTTMEWWIAAGSSSGAPPSPAWWSTTPAPLWWRR